MNPYTPVTPPTLRRVVKNPSSKFRERPCLKGMRQGVIKGDIPRAHREAGRQVAATEAGRAVAVVADERQLQ